MNDHSLQIKCPHCGNKFEPTAALEHDIKHQVERELRKKFDVDMKNQESLMRKQMEEKYSSRLKTLDADRLEKTARLKELEERSLAIEEKERIIQQKEQSMELEMRKRLLASQKEIQLQAEKNATAKARLELQEKEAEIQRMSEAVKLEYEERLRNAVESVREKSEMKSAEIQKQLDDQIRLVNEMKRKHEQGSMQMQGEVQELAIEEYLRKMFPRDSVEEVSKGKRGGDCIHRVRDAFGNEHGTILYESKRTKAFGSDWTSKLKDDMRLTSADLGVLVTEALPHGMTRFGLYDGIWVCTFADFKSLAGVFRDQLHRIGEVRAVSQNKGEKMQLLYDYLTSTSFRQKIEAIVDGFSVMQEDLAREKSHMMAHWAKREKQIYKVMENTSALYGDVRGIAGSAVKAIESLELEDDLPLLTAS